MKKTKLSLCMISCLLAVGGLAGCQKKIKSSNDGVLLTYYIDGEPHQIKADVLLNDYYDDSTKYQSIYDTIYSVIVRNYFAKERTPGVAYEGATPVPLGYSQYAQIGIEAKEKVKNDQQTAKENAKENNTKYKKELEAIYASHGVEDESGLLQKYIEELEKETFEENFYKYSINELKRGDANGNEISVPVNVQGVDPFKWKGYINDQLPYHVSHVMVALSDGSDTNYANGTISEENAKKLYNVVNDLGDVSKSFAKVAIDKSDDKSSGEKQGDLGIMDFSTSFINEFKLGVYAYEQFYNKTTVTGQPIDMSSSKYVAEVGKTYGYEKEADIPANFLPTVNLEVFKDLFDSAKTEKDKEGNSVMEGSTLVYPRNIIYNKYLNIHSVFFIEKTGVTDANTDGVDDSNVRYRKLNDKFILHAEVNGTFKPVIAVRGSSQDKQEIHFIVVNRSPFEDDQETTPTALAKRSINGVSLENYFTTFYPKQSGYPTDSNNKKLKTYVNFLNNEEIDNKSRAEDFASKLKSYDSDKIGKYIFLKYMNEEKITFGDNTKLAKALMKWINTSIEKSDETKAENWEKTVNDYVDKLTRQNSERKNLIPQACRVFFESGNSASKTLEEVSSFASLDAEMKADLISLGGEIVKKINGSNEELLFSEVKDYAIGSYAVHEGVLYVANTAVAPGVWNAAQWDEADIEDELQAYWLTTKVSAAFKDKGGLCNDGKAHF